MPDIQLLERRLAKAAEHIALGEGHLSRQRELIARIESRGGRLGSAFASGNV